MKRLFHPRGIVVIGVSPSRSNLAQRVVRNLVAWRYAGKLVAVGRKRAKVHGIEVVEGLRDPALFQGCDLAVILTPAPTVPGFIRRCGELGIGWAIVESSGFSELHGERTPLERELIEAAREAKVRFIGPNCVGLLQFSGANVSAFAVIEPFEGRGDTAVLTQSGGVGLTMLRALAARGARADWMVSLGNKLDLDEVDLTEYLLANEPVGRMLLYLESIPRGRALCDAIRRSEIPVVVHKVNRTEVSTRVAQSHTSALANDDAVVSAALEQAGAIRARDSLEATLATAATTLGPVRGPRVALVSRSGGHAVIASDACADEGLTLPELSPALLDDLEAMKPSTVIRRGNPLDFGDVFDFELAARMVERVCREDGIDAVVFVMVYNPSAEAEAGRRLVADVAEASRRTGKPVALAVVAEEPELGLLRREAGAPVFGTPEEAMRAVGLLWRREEARLRARGEPVEPDFAGPPWPPGLEGERRVLSVADSLALARIAGVPVVATYPAKSGEAPDFPLVAKYGAAADTVLHKAASGLIRRGIRSRMELAQAVTEIEVRANELGLPPDEVVVQLQLEGVELFLGAKRDPSFGPVVLFGAGGGLVELMGDVELCPYPFTLAEIERLWRRSKVARLAGDRLGAERLARWLAGLGRLLEERPEIESIDLNPVILGERNAWAVDGRVVLLDLDVDRTE